MHHDIKDTLKPLADLLLKREGAACLAICGAGGKSSLAADLSAVLKQTGRAALIAPTTHIFHPRLPGLHSADTAIRSNPQFCDAVLLRKGRPVEELYAEVADMLKKAGSRPLCLAVAEKSLSTDKGLQLEGLDAAILGDIRHALEKDGLHPAILCEADGAERYPFKAHADYEPVIPACADAVVTVMGLDALNRPLSEVCHRPDIAADVLHCAPDTAVTPELAAELLLYTAGAFKGTPDGASRFILLNKLDVLPDTREKELEELRRLLLQSGHIEAVLLRSQTELA